MTSKGRGPRSRSQQWPHKPSRTAGHGQPRAPHSRAPALAAIVSVVVVPHWRLQDTDGPVHHLIRESSPLSQNEPRNQTVFLERPLAIGLSWFCHRVVSNDRCDATNGLAFAPNAPRAASPA
jgi:hypothetical protein